MQIKIVSPPKITERKKKLQKEKKITERMQREIKSDISEYEKINDINVICGLSCLVIFI